MPDKAARAGRWALAAAVLATVMGVAAGAGAVTVDDGVADLSSWQPGDGRVSLAGEWAVAWQSFRDPQSLATVADVQALPERVDMPDYRSGEPGKPAPGDRHATYAVVLDFGERAAGPRRATRPAVTVRAGSPISAGRLYVDGRLVSRSGTPAATIAQENVNSGPLQTTFSPPPAGRVILVLHSSNHALRAAGLTGTLSVNTAAQATRRDLAAIAIKVPLLGGGLVIALIFAVLYSKRRRELGFGLFAGVALTMTVNMAFTTRLIERLGYGGDMSALWRLEYGVNLLMLPFFYHFFQATFPHLYWRWPVKPLWAASGAAVLAAAVAPLWVVGEIWQLGLLAATVLTAAVPLGAALGLLRRQPRAGVILVASAIFGVTALHDIATYLGVLDHSLELRALGMIAFLGLLASFLGWRFQEAFEAADALSARLSSLNADLERRVAERTQELETANAQLLDEKDETERALAELQRANAQIEESLVYAERMQRAALPAARPDELGLAELAIWWQPREHVGGDVYYLGRRGNQVAVLVMDCTGHGVPGALIGFVALAAADRILSQAQEWRPRALLRALDRSVRDQLHRDRDSRLRDDGLEAGLAVIDLAADRLSFAGVGLHLVVQDGEQADTVRGDRGGLGYRDQMMPKTLRRSDLDRASQRRFVLATDGILEQPGGAKGQQLGRRRFASYAGAAAAEAADLEGALTQLQADFAAWRGEGNQRDDLTVVGFRPKEP